MTFFSIQNFPNYSLRLIERRKEGRRGEWKGRKEIRKGKRESEGARNKVKEEEQNGGREGEKPSL
jgi:hypothetical protein